MLTEMIVQHYFITTSITVNKFEMNGCKREGKNSLY